MAVKCRKLAAAVINRAKCDAYEAMSLINTPPPRATRKKTKDQQKLVAYWEGMWGIIRQSLQAHRFLTADRSLWWDIAGVDRPRCQHVWCRQHEDEIAYLESRAQEYAGKLKEVAGDVLLKQSNRKTHTHTGKVATTRTTVGSPRGSRARSRVLHVSSPRRKKRRDA